VVYAYAFTLNGEFYVNIVKMLKKVNRFAYDFYTINKHFEDKKLIIRDCSLVTTENTP